MMLPPYRLGHWVMPFPVSTACAEDIFRMLDGGDDIVVTAPWRSEWRKL